MRTRRERRPRGLTVFGVIPSSVSAGGGAKDYLPLAPEIGTATGGDTQASVAFTASVANGSSAIDYYRATASPGGANATGSSSPIVVPGLTNGIEYTFVVDAHNVVGYSPVSAASNAVTPSA